jgi:hypothetical protein
MTSAAFSIDGTSVPQATGLPVTTTYGATVALAITSVVGAVSVDWSIVGVSAPTVATPTITRAGTPLGATATFTACADPGDGGGVCYGVRCRVTDGAGQVFDSYGLVGVAATVGFIPFVAGESGTWAHATMGWTPRMNALITALAGVVGPQGATGSTGPTGPAGSSGAQGPQGDPGYAATVTIDSVPALYSGSSATVAITVTHDTVWQMGLHGYYLDSGVGTGATQNVVFTPSASHVGSGNITLLGEGNGDYESAYVYTRGTLAVLGSGQGTRSTDTGEDYTVSYTCHAGTSRKLIVFVSAKTASGAPTIGGVTYGGEAMTLIDNQASDDTNGMLWAYYIDDADMPASGAANIVVDVTNTHTATWLIAVELDGAGQGACDATAKAASEENNITTVTTNGYIVSGYAELNLSAISSEDLTEVQEVEGDICGGAAGWALVASPGLTSCDWIAGGGTHPMTIAVAIAPAWV